MYTEIGVGWTNTPIQSWAKRKTERTHPYTRIYMYGCMYIYTLTHIHIVPVKTLVYIHLLTTQVIPNSHFPWPFFSLRFCLSPRSSTDLRRFLISWPFDSFSWLDKLRTLSSKLFLCFKCGYSGLEISSCALTFCYSSLASTSKVQDLVKNRCRGAPLFNSFILRTR